MNKKFGDLFPFFASQTFQKIASLVVLVIILVALPLTIYEVKQQQTVNQHAAWYVPQEQYYACGPALTILLDIYKEIPDCSSGTVSGLKSFQSAVIVKAKSGSQGAYAVHWKWASFWCSTEDPSAPCLQNEQDSSHVDGLTGNNTAYVTAYSPVRSPVGQYAGEACGYYQNDFAFYVTNNDNPNQTICGISLSNPGQTNNNASWCHSGATCSGPTPTPTNIPTPTPTTPVLTPTDTPVPSDTPTDTPTPGLTLTPTDTPPATPSVTLTPTDTPTGTLTPTNTPTPTSPNQPTDTPVPPTGTPKPTLPPTGPGNVLVNTGLIGAAIVVIGLVFAIGL